MTQKELMQIVKALQGAKAAGPVKIKAESKAPSMEQIMGALKGAEIVSDDRHGAGRWIVRKAGRPLALPCGGWISVKIGR